MNTNHHSNNILLNLGIENLNEMQEVAQNAILKDANIFYQFREKDLSKKSLELRGFDSSSAYYGINLQNFNVQLPEPKKINCIVLREAIHLGQTIRRFSIILYDGENKIGEIQGKSVGNKRMITFPAKTITSFQVYLQDAQGNDNISGVAAYLINENFVQK